MIRYRSFFAATLVALCATSAFADTTWDAVKKKFAGASAYELNYSYSGPKGNYKFHYAVVMPDKVRTDIVESSSNPERVGFVTVFAGKDKVLIKAGGGVIPRKLTHADVAGTTLYQPMLKWVVDQANAGGTPTKTNEGGKTRFTFKTGDGTLSIWANDSGDITRTERNDGHTKEIRDLGTIKYGGSPKVDF